MSASLVPVVRLLHFVALALAVGGATAKNLLLIKCRKDHSFAQTFLKIERPVTAQIITGQVLLTLSGTAYAFLLGYGFTARLIAKITLLGVLWVLGPSIDNVVSPRFRKSVPAPGTAATPEFIRALNLYLFWDLTATGIYFAIIVLWMFMS